MRIQTMPVLVIIFHLSASFMSSAQIDADHHCATINVKIPIIVDQKEERERSGTTHNLTHTPEKQIDACYQYRSHDLEFVDGFFSGGYRKIGSQHTYVQTYYGKISSDKQKIEFIELTSDDIYYTGPYIMSVTNTSTKIVNLPLNSDLNLFEFKNGISKISYVEHRKYHEKRLASTVDKIIKEFFVEINMHKLTSFPLVAQIQFCKGEAKKPERGPLLISIGANEPFSKNEGNLISSFVSEFNKFKNSMYSKASNSASADYSISIEEYPIAPNLNQPSEKSSIKAYIKHKGKTTVIDWQDFKLPVNFSHQVFIKLIEVINKSVQ